MSKKYKNQSTNNIIRGFTLIELLGVIVILALIALITIPAVLRITENAKISSYRRSVDLYGKAVSTAINAYKADMVEKHESYQVTFENIQSYIDYEGYDIDCKVSKIYSDDTILLTECTVDGNLVEGEKGKGYGSDNYYYYYTNATKRIRVIEYANAVNEAIKEIENIGNSCEVQDNGNIKCNGNEIEIKSNLEKPISGTLTIENKKVSSYTNLKFADKKVETVQEIPQVIDEQEISTNSNTNNESNNNSNNQNNNNQNNNQNNNVNNQEDTTEPSYIGYYADVDSDGIVDGVIYADLAHSKSGHWGPYIGGIYNGQYSYTAKTNLKGYDVSNNKYNGDFGEKEIVTLKSGSTGNARFYVMALEDFTTSNYSMFFWYNNSVGIMNPRDTAIDFGIGYTNTKTIIEIWNKNGKYKGYYEGATQDNKDIWKYIQSKYQKGWYIPSRDEWAAFADSFANRIDNPLTGNNYDTIYKLSYSYWSSSQKSESSVWGICFGDEQISNSSSGSVLRSVRLGITF